MLTAERHACYHMRMHWRAGMGHMHAARPYASYAPGRARAAEPREGPGTSMPPGLGLVRSLGAFTRRRAWSYSSDAGDAFNQACCARKLDSKALGPRVAAQLGRPRTGIYIQSPPPSAAACISHG